MLRVTADTNIYISAFEFSGLPRRFLDATESGQFELASSEPILAETSRILQSKFHWPAQRIAATLAHLRGCLTLVDPTFAVDAVPDDPDDNRILECAIAAGSQFIVTGDGDLLRLGTYKGIQILKVADFLKQAGL